jgi:hypothetical protein
LHILFLAIFFIASFAQAEENSFDRVHTLISNQVEKISNIGDDFLYNSFSPIKKTNTQDKSHTIDVDTLFQNKKYTSETKKSYVKFSSSYQYNSKEDDELKIRLNASLALHKSNERLHLFFNNFSNNYTQDILEKEGQNETLELGISYIDTIKKALSIRYYFGIHNINPFARARLSYKYKTPNWSIEPIQTLEYSIKDAFEEETNIYIDRALSENILLRLNTSRATKSDEKGMAYGASMSLFWTPQPQTGFQLSQSVSANTRYTYTKTDTEIESVKNGVYNYQTKLTLRQNIFRKWFFYEISPAVNFHHEHDFAPNYSLYIRFDIFFGQAFR